jgi:serine/threonine protein kinase
MKFLQPLLRRVLGKERLPGALKSRINRLTLTPQGNVRKQAGPPFVRAGHRYDPHLLLERELAFLNALNGRHVPRVICTGDDWFEMEHCGVEVNSHNLPANWRDQISAISKVLMEVGVVHRDIKRGNVLVKDGRLYLIDFGWSIWIGEQPYLSPRELSGNAPHQFIYENKTALEWLLSSYTNGKK